MRYTCIKINSHLLILQPCVSMVLLYKSSVDHVTIECKLSRWSRQDLVTGRQSISFKAQIGCQYAKLGLIEEEFWRHAVTGVHMSISRTSVIVPVPETSSAYEIQSMLYLPPHHYAHSPFIMYHYRETL